MTEQVLVSDQVVDLITDSTSLRPSEVFVIGEVGPEEEIQRSVDALIRAWGSVSRFCGVETLEGSVV